MSNFDTKEITLPACPHCGAQDWWERVGLAPKGDRDSWEVKCGGCQKDYVVTMSVSTHFDTRPQPF
ncbi:MAG: hypothetical protein ACTSQ8_25860 [Candidatus Helarchaeota archaeon]